TSTEPEDETSLQQALGIPTDRRMWAVFRALDRGWSLDEIHRLTKIDPWFLTQFHEITELARSARAVGGRDLSDELPRDLKRAGLADSDLARLVDVDEEGLGARRRESGPRGVYKRIDTCAAEFESSAPYVCGTVDDQCEAEPPSWPKAIILGSGPNR